MTMYYIQTVFLRMLIAFDEHHCPVDNQDTCSDRSTAIQCGMSGMVPCCSNDQ